jgi:uncharacterized protein
MFLKMINTGDIIRRHPLVSFLTLTWIISYVIGIPFNMVVSRWLVNGNEVVYGLVPRTVTVYGPAIGALIVTACTAGSDGVKNLLGKLTPTPGVVLRGCVVAITTTLVTFSCFAIARVHTDELLEYLRADGGLLIWQFIGQFVIVGIGEELGWRGWLLPELMRRFSLARTFIIITFFWGSWHLPIFFSPTEFLFPWIIILISLSFIMMWLYIRIKGNILFLAITHAAFNAPVVFIENRLREIAVPDNSFMQGWQLLAYAYLFIAGILFVSTRKLWIRRGQNRELAREG